jgi:hypothetical protein
MNHISVNQTIAPTSTVTVPGLFAVRGAPVKLGDLADTRGRKLKDLIPPAAVQVFVHSGNNHGSNFIVEMLPGFRAEIVPQANLEFSVADLETHTIRAESPGDAISVHYVRLMGDKE